MALIALFGTLEIEMECDFPVTVTLRTDLPAPWAVRETKTVNPQERRYARLRLSGTTKGRQYSLKVLPSTYGTCRVYAARIWARLLTPGSPSGWAWYAVPILEAGDEQWRPVKLPIPEVGDWEARALPIPGVGDWEPVKLPIPETPDWAPVKLPIPEITDWEPVKLPIPEVTDWQPLKLAIDPTPAEPDWVQIDIDQ